MVRKTQHSFAEKMKTVMKLACIIGAGILNATNSHARTNHASDMVCIGTGYSTSMNGCIEFCIEHYIASRWSVSISTGFNIRRPSILLTEESISHHQEFSSSPSVSERLIDTHKESFTFSYWPLKTYQGISLSLGAEYIGKEGLDAICCINYRLSIWKGLSLDIGYSIRCIDQLIRSADHNGNAGIKILYRF